MHIASDTKCNGFVTLMVNSVTFAISTGNHALFVRKRYVKHFRLVKLVAWNLYKSWTWVEAYAHAAWSSCRICWSLKNIFLIGIQFSGSRGCAAELRKGKSWALLINWLFLRKLMLISSVFAQCSSDLSAKSVISISIRMNGNGNFRQKFKTFSIWLDFFYLSVFSFLSHCSELQIARNFTV